MAWLLQRFHVTCSRSSHEQAFAYRCDYACGERKDYRQIHEGSIEPDWSSDMASFVSRAKLIVDRAQSLR